MQKRDIGYAQNMVTWIQKFLSCNCSCSHGDQSQSPDGKKDQGEYWLQPVHRYENPLEGQFQVAGIKQSKSNEKYGEETTWNENVKGDGSSSGEKHKFLVDDSQASQATEIAVVEFKCCPPVTGMEVTQIESVPPAVVVTDIEPSSCFSKSSSSTAGLNRGDVILDVGGVQEARAMQQAIKDAILKENTIKVKVARRPLAFSVTVVADGMQKIGVFVEPNKQADALRVERVLSHGLIAMWNIKHPDRVVCAGDLIIDVSGTSGEPTKILNKAITACKTAGNEVVLKVEADV